MAPRLPLSSAQRTRRPVALECVINISDGIEGARIEDIGGAAGAALLDLHRDAEHNRSVLTLGGPDVEEAARRVTSEAVRRLDLSEHRGAHPRLGVVDVAPFVPLADDGLDDPAAARGRLAKWAGGVLDLPCFEYGPTTDGAVRTLPEVRRGAFSRLTPNTGPPQPHPTAGAMAVGARRPLVAYNLWLDGGDVDLARAVAAAVRRREVRALAFELPTGLQVSCNLIEPLAVGPADIYDEVARLLADRDATIKRAELVGLIEARVLRAVPPSRWTTLDLGPDATVEARLEERGFRRR